mmetsp:Transcript_2757/g.5947  ORF Transcript_2757/g.5947 Transcript_2757/m.5947 type:complete len:372 (+) Transcript_2757:462-1577(+)
MGSPVELENLAVRTEVPLFQTSGLVHSNSTESPPWERARTTTGAAAEASPPEGADGAAGAERTSRGFAAGPPPEGAAAGGDPPKMSPMGAAGAGAAGAPPKMSPMGAAIGVAGGGAAGAAAGGAENMSERRSTSLDGAEAAAAGAAPEGAAGAAGAAAPPPKISLRSRRSPPPPPPPDAAAALGALTVFAGAVPFSLSSKDSIPIPAPMSGALFLCMTLRSTAGIRARASLAAAITSADTAPPPLSPRMFSVSPSDLLAAETPLTAQRRASYSQDRSCSSRLWDPPSLLTSLWSLSRVTASAVPWNRSLSLAKAVRAVSRTSAGQEWRAVAASTVSTTLEGSRAMKETETGLSPSFMSATSLRAPELLGGW